MSQTELIDATESVQLGVADEVIGELRKRLTGRKADTHQGYEMVRAGIAEVTKYRTGVGRAGKELKASAIALQKKVNVEVSRVTDLLLEIEIPLRQEKSRVDNEAERKLEEQQEKERLAIEVQELAEKQAREAEEAAQREAERKEREVEDARLAAQREALELDRKRLADEHREQQEGIEKERRANADEREKIEADKLAITEVERVARRDAREVAEELQLKERRAKTAEAEKVRLVEEESEAERLAEERKPDADKLREFGVTIEALTRPCLSTDWGSTTLRYIENHLRNAAIMALLNEATDDHLTAEAAAETVSEQSPSVS